VDDKKILIKKCHKIKKEKEMEILKIKNSFKQTATLEELPIRHLTVKTDKETLRNLNSQETHQMKQIKRWELNGLCG